MNHERDEISIVPSEELRRALLNGATKTSNDLKWARNEGLMEKVCLLFRCFVRDVEVYF
jgi:hypothetical protein